MRIVFPNRSAQSLFHAPGTVKAMESGRVKVDADALASDIDRIGHASVYGIYFDTGKSELNPESRPALDEIARLLQNRGSLSLYVVGHTDMVGGFEMNLRLSKDRPKGPRGEAGSSGQAPSLRRAGSPHPGRECP